MAATVGSRTVLMCDTIGLPKPDVTWEKDGETVAVNEHGYVMHRTGSLQFSAVRVEDSGTYRCIARNDAGTVTRDINLSVQGKHLESVDRES